MVCQRKDSEWEQHNIRMRRRIAQQARSMRQGVACHVNAVVEKSHNG